MIGPRRKPIAAVDYGEAMQGRPVRTPVVRTEEKGEKLYVTVEYARPRWQRWMGGDTTCQRTFGLDPYGRYVYEACDGKQTVSRMTRHFARDHKISVAEAEVSVTAFLRTLIAKGLVGVRVDKPSARD
jgi:hypothetical protein